MKNLTSVLRYKNMLTSTSSAKITTNQNNREPFKPCRVQQTRNLPVKTVSTMKNKSLNDSLLVISSVCKGVILCPGARNLNTPIPKFRMQPIRRYVDDFPAGQTPRERQEHEKILAEQQKQLERLKKEIKERESVEKFPKYKPK